MTGTRVWLVTGASSGIGRALVTEVLSASADLVIAVFRRRDEADAWEAGAEGRAFGVVADVRDEAAVRAAVREGISRAGGLDVVVNSAGYGLVGAVEEIDEEELRQQLEVNLLGVHRVLRATLPALRRQRSGCFVVISSVAGQVPGLGLGGYDASKGALELLSGALALELEPLGIKVLIVEPGNIRTAWAGRSMRFARNRIIDYDDTAGASRTFFQKLNGHQDGDPSVVASVIRAAVADPTAPLRLVIGQDAHDWIASELAHRGNDLDRWRPSTPSPGDQLRSQAE